MKNQIGNLNTHNEKAIRELADAKVERLRKGKNKRFEWIAIVSGIVVLGGVMLLALLW